MLQRALLIAVACLCAGAAPAPAATPRIFNGRSVAGVPGWMGFVAARAGGGVNGCGGAAIAPNVVMTAAHCLVDESSNAWVRASDVAVAFRQSDPWGALGAGNLTVDRVVDFYAPSNYAALGSGGSVNDVALLRLQSPAPGTLDLLPAGNSALLAVGRPAAVVGWGLTGADKLPQALQQGDFTLQPYDRCGVRFAGYDPRTALCAYGSGSQSTCQGDSGSPLLVFGSSNTPYAIGVVTSGIAGCDPAYPDVFSNVATGSLATFVSRYRGTLQQAAGSLAPDSPASLGRAAAIAIARAYASRHWGMRVYNAACLRRSSAQFRCRVEGAKLGRRGWIGHMTVRRTARGVIVTR